MAVIRHTIDNRFVPSYSAQSALFFIDRIMYYLLDVIEILLVFRFVFKLLGASPTSRFAELVYRLSDPLLAPFQGVMGSTVAGVSVIEWSTLIAMATFAILTYIVVRLIHLLTVPPSDQVVEYTY